MAEEQAVEMSERRCIAHLGCGECGREVTVRTDRISCPNCNAVLWEDEDCADMLHEIALRISANIGFDPSVVSSDLIATAKRLRALSSRTPSLDSEEIISFVVKVPAQRGWIRWGKGKTCRTEADARSAAVIASEHHSKARVVERRSFIRERILATLNQMKKGE